MHNAQVSVENVLLYLRLALTYYTHPPQSFLTLCFLLSMFLKMHFKSYKEKNLAIVWRMDCRGQELGKSREAS